MQDVSWEVLGWRMIQLCRLHRLPSPNHGPSGLLICRAGPSQFLEERFENWDSTALEHFLYDHFDLRFWGVPH